MVATAIFAIVIGLALQQITESTDVTRTTTAQADLRRTADNVLSLIVRELRSTQARFASADSTGIECWRVVGFDPGTGSTAQIPPITPAISATSAHPLIQVKSGAATPPTAADCVIHQYDRNGTTPDGLYGILRYRFGADNLGSASTIELSRELALPNDPDLPANYAAVPNGGFEITSSTTLPGRMSASSSNRFTDAPTTVTIRLVLKRLISRDRASNYNRQYVWATTATSVMLKASASY